MHDPERLRRYSQLFGRHGHTQSRAGYRVYQTYKTRLATVTSAEKTALSEFVRDVNDVLEGSMDATYFGRKWQLPIESSEDLQLWIDERKQEAEALYSLMTPEQRAEIDAMVIDVLLADTNLSEDLIRMAENLIDKGDIPQKTEVPDAFMHGWDDEGDKDDETDEDDEDKWCRWQNLLWAY
ncbi:hypothetical protein LCGC14_1022740 [marine sediment metagenome]|uniref:Uncharacterized protein n=1 Tax=marine sediment metagenome TaxID=412755 RepID=A0A0F9QF51_9ZZZZ